MKLKLLGKAPDAKTQKSLKEGVTTFIMYLNPTMKGICPKATAGCKTACLFTAGRGSFKNVIDARTRKTQAYLDNPALFRIMLNQDLEHVRQYAKRTGKKVAVRLNGTSDIDFTGVIQHNPDIQFYDYTKVMKTWETARLIPNYHVTFSESESNKDECRHVLWNGGNVASVFSGPIMEGQTHLGYRVIDGDKSDYRVGDPENVIVGLKAKGRAKKDTRKFVLPMVS